MASLTDHEALDQHEDTLTIAMLTASTLIVEPPIPAPMATPSGSVVDVLGHLGFEPDDIVCVGSQEVGGAFTQTLVRVQHAPGVVAQHAHTNTWVSAHPLREGITSGRGTSEDVRGLLALTLDLDVGGLRLRTFEDAWALIAHLSRVLGAEPDVVVRTGHGLQPSWRLGGEGTRWSAHPSLEAQGAALLRDRFQRYASRVAEADCSAKIDTVSDAARVRRAPGTWNRKYPSDPVPTRSHVRDRGVEPLLTIAEAGHRLALAEPRYPKVPKAPGAPTAPRETRRASAVAMAEVATFIAAHPTGSHSWLLRPLLARFDAAVSVGGSRHETAVLVAHDIARDIAAGLLAGDAFEPLRERFIDAVTHDAATGPTRGPDDAEHEWLDIVAWAIGQAGLINPTERRAEVLHRASPLPTEPADEDPGVPLDERDTPTDPATTTATAAPEPEETTTVVEPEQSVTGWPCQIRSGGGFVLDQPDHIPAVWGSDQGVLWAEGESLILTGIPGVGKSTLAGQVVRARLGLGSGAVLGMPVAPTASRVLYLAMDRPQQIARSLARQFGPEDRDVLDERLRVWSGPPPGDLARQPAGLLEMARAAGADTVVVDSLKDAAIGLTEDEVGAGWNRARQHALANGVQVLELHHMVKRNSAGGAPTSLADVYGSTWITSGAGSVVLLHGEPGDPVVSLRHLKQPGAEVGPWQVTHDHAAGTSSVQQGADLLTIVAARGQVGITVKAAATALYSTDSPNRAQVERARRRLGDLVRAGSLVEGDVAAAPGVPVVWRVAA